MASKTEQYKLEWLQVKDLARDPTNNRPMTEADAKRIAEDLDTDALGQITVSRRSDGQLFIVDGQHRAHAFVVLGWEDRRVPCRVFDGLTRAEEAALFVRLNNFRAVRYFDKFRSRITAGDPDACAIARIVAEHGYRFTHAPENGGISAVKALEDVYLGRGQKVKGKRPEAVANTVVAVTGAWGRTPEAVKGEVIQGVGAFLLRYGSAVELPRLQDKLRRVPGGPVGLVSRGKGKQEIHGGKLAAGIGHYITDEYNKGLPRTRRLPAWR